MKQIWTAFYWKDYSADTEHLSMIEHGAYLLLMKHYYITSKPLVANATVLQRVCRAFAKEEIEAVATILNQFFVLQDDGYHHKRIDLELEKAHEIRQVRRNAGLKGLLKQASKKANALANATVLPVQMPTQSQSHTHIEPKHIYARPSLEEITPYCQERSVDANKFWDFYESKGWMVGKNRMKDWKAAVRNWGRNGNGQVSKSKQRIAENRQTILDALRSRVSEDAGSIDERDGLQGDNDPGNEGMAGNAFKALAGGN